MMFGMLAVVCKRNLAINPVTVGLLHFREREKPAKGGLSLTEL
jgi:hypothetical protein